MIVDLDRLSESPEKICSEEVVSIRDVLDAERKIECLVDVTARKSGETFYFQTKLHGTLSTQCHKCLQPTDFGIDTAFEVVVQRGGTAKAGTDRAVEEDFVYLPIGEQEFSLDQHIYENLVVNIPMQIICREDCKGLCPICGANMNKDPCTCERSGDSRWDALKSLKDKLPKSQR
ncbi:MAG: hypothetical protein GTO51_03900 [Candidatus Latescibacteria bacterium]|nr:hypothetical protein [Candidatus Latescibacterota bacterium]NIM20983.1 hypothetical protein [Candidatus Latescibacterota bacterium]NIM65118.1 hypothetical protein [Candidatus Latescibacterota bacterium]NIO01633.1 hypothetical protein [Candidatus Latescibacterota bacterium]NIO28150.1 hypothetical protein [Candidatus Latescibacterota bacterium]